MSSFTKYYKIIQPEDRTANMAQNGDISGAMSGYHEFGSYSWYNTMVCGSDERERRYKEYDRMDKDVSVSRALDIIAEEMTGQHTDPNKPLDLNIDSDLGDEMDGRRVATLRAALKTWIRVNDLKTRLFRIARETIKYGDCLFVKPNRQNRLKKWSFVGAKSILSADISIYDVTDVRRWHIQPDIRHYSALNRTGTSLHSFSGSASTGGIDIMDEDIVRFTLANDMSNSAPFGESVLLNIYEAFNKKELLESATIIHRVVRAPEKRLFRIDVGTTHPNNVETILRSVEVSAKQKKVPIMIGNDALQVDTSYNPQSMQEDFYFATRPDGSGSTVEVLPGSTAMSDMDEVEYFYSRMWEGLRIPRSYIDSGAEGGAFNDGKVGIAYMQEIKFSQFVERLQHNINATLDEEFKNFVFDLGIKISPEYYSISLPQPTNWRHSREQALQADALSNLSTAMGIDGLSKRYAFLKYGQWTEEDIRMNEFYRRGELGLNPESDDRDLPRLYNPDEAEARGFEGGLGGGFDSGFDAPDIGGDEEGMEDGPEDDGGDDEASTPPASEPPSDGADTEDKSTNP